MSTLIRSKLPIPKTIRYVTDPKDFEEVSPTQKALAENLKKISLERYGSKAQQDQGSSRKSGEESLYSSTIDPGRQVDAYISSRPEKLDADALKKQTADILLDEKKKEALQRLTCGDQKNEVKPKLGKRTQKKIKKIEREKTKGPGWFEFSAPEITEEVKRDLEVLQMRGALDPKRFYKKNDHKALPKYFQIGQVVDSPVDYYSDRIPKRERKNNLVDELLADAEFRKYNKRKYAEIIDEKSKYQKRRFKVKKTKKNKVAQ